MPWPRWALPTLLQGRRAVLALSGAGLAATAAVVAHHVLTDPPGAPGGSSALRGGADLSLSSAAFTVGGGPARPMAPGVSVPIDVLLENASGTALTVTDVRVTISGLTAPNAGPGSPCGAGDFTVVPASAGLAVTLPARGARTLGELGVPPSEWPRVGMVDRPANQDGCQGATLTLAYDATGRSR